MTQPRKKIHRFFAPFSDDEKEIRIANPELVHHVLGVLHMSVGEPVILVDRGMEAVALMIKAEKTGFVLKVTEIRPAAAEPKKKIMAFVAMFKKEPFEWMLEKLTEIGVTEIVPMETARTVRFPWKPERFKTILKESAEQSGRGVIPVLHEPMSFKHALTHAKTNTANYLFEIGGAPLTSHADDTIGYFIGPEGGWDMKEVQEAEVSGVQVVALGTLTMRAETAAIIAAYELLK